MTHLPTELLPSSFVEEDGLDADEKLRIVPWECNRVANAVRVFDDVINRFIVVNGVYANVCIYIRL
jgi:hypothetical protein